MDDAIWTRILRASDLNTVRNGRLVSHHMKHLIDHEVLRYQFLETYRIGRILQEPCSPLAYALCDDTRLVKKLRLGREHRSLSSIAVERNTTVSCLKRMNGLLGDSAAALGCRDYVLVPWQQPDNDVDGTTNSGVLTRQRAASFEMCRYTNRYVIVITEEDGGSPLADGRAVTEWMSPANKLAWGMTVLKNALLIDEETAEYYLQESGGNVRKAVQLYKEDGEWVDKMKDLKKMLKKALRKGGSRIGGQ